MTRRRILLVLPRYRSTVLPALTRAFSYFGWNFQIFDFREFTYLERTISLSGQRPLAYRLLNERLKKIIFDYQPEIFFTVKGETILPETVAAMRKIGGISINWFPDDFRLYDLSKRLSRWYDIFLYAESFLVPYLKRETGKKAVYHFPFGADILPQDPYPPKLPKRYNLTMVGTVYPVRLDLLPDVSDLGLHIWGDQSWSKTGLAKFWHGPLAFKDIFGVYSQSRVAINMDYSSIGNSVLNRAYEIMTSGTMCLARSRPELGKYFQINKEVVAFSSDSELREKAEYYLKHAREREVIASNGYKAARARHTYVQRFEKLFRVLSI